MGYSPKDCKELTQLSNYTCTQTPLISSCCSHPPGPPDFNSWLMSLSSTQLQYSFSHFKIQIDDLSNSVATKVLYLLSSIILCITLHQPLSPMRHLQFSSVTQLCPTLCDPMDCGTPDLSPSPTPGVYSNTYPLSQ